MRRSSGRVGALDALRGLAALVVVFHHTLLTVPALADAYAVPGARPAGFAGWLAYSPLHLLWDGPEAVLVFFVLSGYVLSVRGLRGGRLAYYGGRLLRLYLPAAAAVVVATWLAMAVPRRPVSGASWWLNWHAAAALSPARLLHELSLLSARPDFVDPPLWSLRWEVLFSLLLPVYLLLARRGRRWWLHKIVLLVAASAAGAATGHDALAYLPVFAVGVILHAERERLSAATQRMTGLGWNCLLVLAVAGLNVQWTWSGPAGVAVLRSGAAQAGGVAGAALLVWWTCSAPGAGSLGERRWLGWLGSRSFSLYLVHEPLVVSLALLLGPARGVVPLLLLGVPASLLAAELFYRWVEHPGHALARMLAGRLRRPAAAAAAPVAPPRLPLGSEPEAVVA